VTLTDQEIKLLISICSVESINKHVKRAPDVKDIDEPALERTLAEYPSSGTRSNLRDTTPGLPSQQFSTSSFGLSSHVDPSQVLHNYLPSRQQHGMQIGRQNDMFTFGADSDAEDDEGSALADRTLPPSQDYSELVTSGYEVTKFNGTSFAHRQPIVRSLQNSSQGPTTRFPPVVAPSPITEHLDYYQEYSVPKVDQNAGGRALDSASTSSAFQSSKPIVPVSNGPNTASPPSASIEIGLARHFNFIPTSRISPEEEEPSTIRCICSYTEDDGNTVLCEKCETWQHVACYYDSARHVPDIHECVHCLPRAIDSEKANEKQSILRRRLTRGLKTNGLQKRARSHSRKVDPSGSRQPEQTTVNVQSFLQHFYNYPKSRWEPIAPIVRAQTAYQFFSVYSQKWLHHDDLAMNLALQSEKKVSYGFTHRM
jgi:hypothetical protein